MQRTEVLELEIRSLRKEISSLKEKTPPLVPSSSSKYDNLEQAFLLSPGHVYWKDKNGVYQACNDGQAKTLGYPSGKDVVGKTDFDLPWKTSASALREIDKQVFDTRKEFVAEEPVLLPNGEKAVFLSRKTPLYGKHGDLIGLIGVSFDITQEKKIQKLEQEKGISEGIILQLKTIAGSLSHELRTPLAGIKLGVVSIKRFLKKLTKERQALMGNQHCQEQLSCSIDDFNRKIHSLDELETAIDAGNELISIQLRNMRTASIDTSNFTRCDIQNCINEALRTFPVSDKTQRDLIHVDIKHHFSFMSDLILMKHMLWNLLNNALHFIEEECKGEIFITTDTTPEHNVLRVKDTAKGMPPEIAKHVFQQFYSKRNGGSGLGLNFCKLLMEAMGGHISCQAEENEYAEFSLYFPKD